MKYIRFITIAIILCIINSCIVYANDTTSINDSQEKVSIDSTENIIAPIANKEVLVYKFHIQEMIAPPVWRKTKNAFIEAKEMNADIIIISMNTYGGLLDAADSIRTIILQSDIPVYVFIDNNAASAGALISIACDSIYMRPGGNIGAATVVNQKSEALPDKYQSYMRSLMRATAEINGRDPNIAQSMVDPSIYIKGIADSGKVTTFTSREAIEFGFCEREVYGIEDILHGSGITEYTIVKQEITITDRLIGFLIHPAVSGVILMIIIGGIYFEMQSPGIGFPLAASAIAALLYFAPHYLEGLAENWEILLFVIGLILVAIEVFAIPGFGVAGVGGFFFIVTGLTLSMINNQGFDFTFVSLPAIAISFFTVIIAMFISITSSLILSKYFITQTRFSALALNKSQVTEEGYNISDNKFYHLTGKKGITKTILRPSGKIIIDNDVYDATTEAGYIEKDTTIIVTGYMNAQLTVDKESH